ncbi:pilus assembly protein PilP [Lonepinella sp. MS14435]|uniref:pilus assembly protein PilP n=1 Tax=Lonepinella sp. MS14435 TaxID=3003618 RepID=UPI0036DBA2BD
MLTKITSLIIALFCSVALAKTDPFDKNQRTQDMVQSDNTAKTQTAQCLQKHANIMPKTPFNQLTLIGILLFKDRKQILLQNKNGEIDSAKEHDLIGIDSYQLQNINKTQAEFLTWKADCSAGEVIILKL